MTEDRTEKTGKQMVVARPDVLSTKEGDLTPLGQLCFDSQRAGLYEEGFSLGMARMLSMFVDVVGAYHREGQVTPESLQLLGRIRSTLADQGVIDQSRTIIARAAEMARARRSQAERSESNEPREHHPEEETERFEDGEG